MRAGKPPHVIGDYGYHSSSHSSHSSGGKSSEKKRGNPNGFSLKQIRENARKKVLEIAKKRKWLEQPRRADLIKILNKKEVRKK